MFRISVSKMYTNFTQKHERKTPLGYPAIDEEILKLI
jgi:hypothetical protein